MVEVIGNKMIIKYSFLNDPDIGNVLVKLKNCDDFPVKTGYRVGKFTNKMMDEMIKARDKFGSLVRKYAKLDEKGQPLGLTESKLQFESDEKQTEYNQEFDSLLDATFEIDFFMMNPDHLKPAKLTAGELAKFGQFIDLN